MNEASISESIMKCLMDESVIHQMIADLDEKTCHKLIGLFIDEITTSLKDLEIAFSSMNLKKIEEITHILKNSAALYGAMSVASMASEINDRLCSAPGRLTDADTQLLDVIKQTLKLYSNKYDKAI